MNRQENSDRIGIVIISGIILLYVIPYFFLPVGWFGDDGAIFNFARRNGNASLADIFLFRDDCMRRYRPLMQILATMSLRYSGFDAILIRFLSYLAFAAAIVTLFMLVRVKTNHVWSPVFGAAFFALSPVKVQSLFRIGRPEIFVTAFCLLAVYCLHKGLEATARNNTSINPWSTGSFILAVMTALWSETGISVFAVMMIWILTSNRTILTKEPHRFQNASLRMLIMPIAGITLYLLWYAAINAPLSSGESDSRYSIHLGWNLVQNILSSLTALASPVSTVTAVRLFRGAANGWDWISLFAGMAGIAVIGVALFRGTLSAGRTFGAASVFLACSVVSLFPFVIIGHVSEVYLAQAAAFFWGGAGILAGNAIENGSRARRLGLCCASGLLAIVMLYSSANAHALLRQNAGTFQSLHEDLTYYRRIGEQRLILFPYSPALNFSQYYLPTHKLLFYTGDDMPVITWAFYCPAKNPEHGPYPWLQVLPNGKLLRLETGDPPEQSK